MSLPGDVKTITVTGDWRDMLGGQISGTVTFVPSATPLLDATDSMWFEAAPIVGTLTGNGTLSLLVPCTDQYTPANWTYEVTESFTSGAGPNKATFGRTYFLALPSTLGSTVSLTGLAPLSVAPDVIGSLPLPSGASPVAGSVPAATGSGQASAWSGSVRLASGAAPSVSLPGLPVGYGNSEQVTGLQVGSAHPSDDINGGTDGTGRINLYSYQRAATNSFGETIRNFLMRWDAKAMTAWYGPVSLYDGSGNAITTNGWRPWAWAGAHYEANDHGSIHAHWEIEVPDTTGALQGRFSVGFGDPVAGTIGLDKSNIVTNLADFTFQASGLDHNGAYQEQYLRISAPAGNEKPLEWNNSSTAANVGTGLRWRLVANTTAESGSDAGTDLAVRRYSDSGSLLDTALYVRRSDGEMTSGAEAGAGARLGLIWGTAIHGFSAQPSVSPGSAAGFDAQMTATTDRAYQADVSGDTNRRLIVLADGTHKWGTGSATQDTQVQRTGAGRLTLTDLASAGNAYLLVGGSVLVGGTSTLGDGGVGVLALANATTTPTGAPTGGVALYASSGALYVRGTNGVSYQLGPPSGSYLCAPSSYAPGTRVTDSTTSTTLSAVSSSNISTGSFTAPASGDVVVSVSLTASIGTANNHAAFALAAHGTVTPVLSNTVIWTNGTTAAPCCFQFLVTGLTAGTSYNLDLLYSSPDGATVSVLAQGVSTTTPAATSGGPVVMTVQAV